MPPAIALDVERATAAVAHSIAEAGYVSNSCILGARALEEVLDYHGIASELWVVGVLIGNAEAAERLRDNVPTADWPDTAWTVVVDPDSPPLPGAWAGHLVVEAEGLLLDPTARQFARPAKAMHVPDSIALPWDAIAAEWHGEHGEWARYYPRPDAPMPTHARDWERRKWAKTAGRAIRALREG